MKRLLALVALMAFAVAVQAGDAKSKSTDADSHACCSKMKASTQASAGCPMSSKMQTSTEAKSCCPMMTAAKTGGCSGDKIASVKKTYVKQVLHSPKAAAAL